MIKFLQTPLKALDDFHGKQSSKRFWGCRLLTIGVYLELILFVINIAYTAWTGRALIGTHDNCHEIANMFIYAGGGLLFGGVFETGVAKIKNRFGKK